jgi:hypothetical protein
MLGAMLASAWLCITYQFARRRLAKNSKSPKHYLEMVLTSAAIPWLSLWYQLRGWWRFRRCEPFAPPEAERISGRAVELAP